MTVVVRASRGQTGDEEKASRRRDDPPRGRTTKAERPLATAEKQRSA